MCFSNLVVTRREAGKESGAAAAMPLAEAARFPIWKRVQDQNVQDLAILEYFQSIFVIISVRIGIG